MWIATGLNRIVSVIQWFIVKFKSKLSPHLIDGTLDFWSGG